MYVSYVDRSQNMITMTSEKFHHFVNNVQKVWMFAVITSDTGDVLFQMGTDFVMGESSFVTEQWKIEILGAETAIYGPQKSRKPNHW